MSAIPYGSAIGSDGGRGADAPDGGSEIELRRLQERWMRAVRRHPDHEPPRPRGVSALGIIRMIGGAIPWTPSSDHYRRTVEEGGDADACVAADFDDVSRLLGSVRTGIGIPASASWDHAVGDVLGPWRMGRVIDVMSLADSVGFGIELADDAIYGTHRHLAAALYHHRNGVMAVSAATQDARAAARVRAVMEPDAVAALYLLDVVMHPADPYYAQSYADGNRLVAPGRGRAPAGSRSISWLISLLTSRGCPPARMRIHDDRGWDDAGRIPLVSIVDSMCDRGFAWTADMLAAFLKRAAAIGLPGMMETDPYCQGCPMGRSNAHPLGVFGLVVGRMAESPDWDRLLRGDGEAFGIALADGWGRACSTHRVISHVLSTFPSLSLHERWHDAMVADASIAWPLTDEYGIAWLLGHDDALESEAAGLVYDRMVTALEAEAEHGSPLRDWAMVRDWVRTVDDSWPRACRGLGHPVITGDAESRLAPGPFELPGTRHGWLFTGFGSEPVEMWRMIAAMTSHAGLLAAMETAGILLSLATMAGDDAGRNPTPWVRFPPASVERVTTLLEEGCPRDMILEDPMLHVGAHGNAPASESTTGVGR